jgi:hypothetical protein
VGSFYAYAIWIGLGVLAVYDFLKKKTKLSVAAPLATLVCLLAVPVLMGFQEWDDHDRSTKTVARDVASDYLNSCAPNAILFTVGDNDTYPLWYAQEVENVRPDVRVINLSLLGVDWYIDQQRQMVNKSAGVPMSWTPDKYRGETRNYIRFYDAGTFPQDKFYNLKEVMDFMGTDDPRAKLTTQDGEQQNYLPAQKLFIPVDVAQAINSGVVDIHDSARILPQLPFQISKQYLLKNDLAVYDIITANNWKRPIYFTSPTDLGINDYLRMDGLTYRLVPLKKEESNDPMGAEKNVNVPVMYDNLMKKFTFGGANVNGTYFDEPNRKLLQYVRNAYTRLGTALAIDNKKDSALTVLNKADKNLLENTFPYAMTTPGQMYNYSSMQTVYAYYLAGDKKKADEIAQKIIKDCNQQLMYYRQLPSSKLTSDLQHDGQMAEQFISLLGRMKQDFSDSTRRGVQEQTPVISTEEDTTDK